MHPDENKETPKASATISTNTITSNYRNNHLSNYNLNLRYVFHSQ